MSDPIFHPRGFIDFPTLTGYTASGNHGIQDAEEAKKQLLIENERLARLKQLVGSDSQTRFKVERIHMHAPLLEKSISDELGTSLAWPLNACLMAEVMQFRKGKSFVPQPSEKLVANLSPNVKVSTLLAPADGFILHFYVRKDAGPLNGKERFVNMAGDVMATIDGTGAITSFELLVKSKEDRILGSSAKGVIDISFVEGEDYVELLQNPSPRVTQMVQETCDSVLQTLLQQGRLQPLRVR